MVLLFSTALSFSCWFLCDDMIGLTENAMELMEQFFELKLQSKNILHKFKKNYLKIDAETNIEFESDSEDDNGGA